MCNPTVPKAFPPHCALSGFGFIIGFIQLVLVCASAYNHTAHHPRGTRRSCCPLVCSPVLLRPTFLPQRKYFLPTGVETVGSTRRSQECYNIPCDQQSEIEEVHIQTNCSTSEALLPGREERLDVHAMTCRHLLCYASLLSHSACHEH